MKPSAALPFDPKVFLAKVGDGKTISAYHRNQVVFSQGDAADAVFHIQKGRVKLTVVSEHGKEAVIAILGAGDFFGEGCLGGQRLRMATSTTISECSIVRLEKAGTIRVLHDEPIFSELFLAYLLSRNIRLEEDLVDQLFNSSEKRLARVLLLLANFGKEDGAGHSEDQPGDAGEDRRHHALESQLLHEQIPQAGPHRLRRRAGGSQLAAECRPARLKFGDSEQSCTDLEGCLC
jgi:CRP-like cAMP-binding protein